MSPRFRNQTAANQRWLREHMSPYFFQSMKDEPQALELLARELGTLQFNRQLVLADRAKTLICAVPNLPGSLYATLQHLHERELSYAMFSHSAAPLPGREETLEIQRFEFDRKENAEILARQEEEIPSALRRRVAQGLRQCYPDFDLRGLDRILRLLWLNNPGYVAHASPRRLAQVVHLYHQGNHNGGLYLDVEPLEDGEESRVHFAVGNPPQRDFLLQVLEVFNRLDLGVNRAYCLIISNGVHPYFLATFYVQRRDGQRLQRGDELFTRLQQELNFTQILSTRSPVYRELVVAGVVPGAEATLIDVLITFCHTILAHAQPDRFGLDDVRAAYLSHPATVLQLVELFRLRFDPALTGREELYRAARQRLQESVAVYNTGHRHLDELRRTVFACGLAFVHHTLKTNFYVTEKQALAFRLDPACLAELPPAALADLPPASPYRMTFFFSRYGFGYHIGFSDIARGGWRTVVTRSRDDFSANAETLFRENFILAHTQHLKNKDIYEGGSKLVTILDVSDLKGGDRVLENWRLFKLQYGIAGAFLDIFVTQNGVASHPAVIDYYRQDEPIELGPDENMHDDMIETIAALSKRRGYLLGIGIMSSKRAGINHKAYGVTSTGVVTFAEIALAEVGIDLRRDPFSLKMTGGPNGDVAGNALRILLDRAPCVHIRLILDGTAALYDPEGIDHAALRRILLRQDLDAFDAEALHPGGMLLFRSNSRREGLRELYRKVTRTATGLTEEWLSIDDFSREYAALPFVVEADLFIPAGGRPETIDGVNWPQFLLADGRPSAKVIVEGANSFITPEAREQLQRHGLLLLRDSSANKCGVISSSYEIIANLLLSEEEFLAQKERYVADVLTILERRAADEARLIMQRRHANPLLLGTEISDRISSEINANYARLFHYFQQNPEISLQPAYRRAILAHLPQMIGAEPRWRRRIARLPEKYRFAILAAEIGSSMVYQGGDEADFVAVMRHHLTRYADVGRSGGRMEGSTAAG